MLRVSQKRHNWILPHSCHSCSLLSSLNNDHLNNCPLRSLHQLARTSNGGVMWCFVCDINGVATCVCGDGKLAASS